MQKGVCKCVCRAMKFFWPQSRGEAIAPLAPPVDPPLNKSLIKNIKRTRGAHFTILPASPCAAEFMKFGVRGQLTDTIMCVKFLVNLFRDYRVLTPQHCPFPLTCCVPLTTVYALWCYTVIGKWSVLLHVHGHLAEFLLARLVR